MMSRLSINVAKHPNGTPLLGKGGVAAPINKKRRSLLSGRRGWFVPATDYRKLNEPPRPRFSKERGHLLDGAATPPLPRRGVPFGCFATFQVHCVFTNPTVLPAEVRRSDLRKCGEYIRVFADVVGLFLCAFCGLIFVKT